MGLKKNFFRVVQRQLQKIGVFIGRNPELGYSNVQYFKDIRKIPEFLEKRDENIQGYELKKILKAVGYAKNNRLYNRLLGVFIPKWRSKTNGSYNFFSEGSGGQNLNVYRRVKIGNETEFEKVYLTNSISWKKILIFEKFIRKEIEDVIESPKIVQSLGGALISIAYFEFVKEPRVPEEKLFKEIKKIINTLFDISEKKIDRFKDLPSFLFDYTLYPHYRWNEKKAKAQLKKVGVNYLKIENAITSKPFVLTHGDLKGKHIYAKRTLIDWDEFGLYPLGFEQAYIYYGNYIKQGLKGELPIRWIESFFPDRIKKNDKLFMRVGFMYFLYVFGYKEIVNEKYSLERESIVNELRTLLRVI